MNWAKDTYIFDPSQKTEEIHGQFLKFHTLENATVSVELPPYIMPGCLYFTCVRFDFLLNCIHCLPNYESSYLDCLPEGPESLSGCLQNVQLLTPSLSLV